MFVRKEEGEVIRLAWEPADGARNQPGGKTTRWRALPPGAYTVIGYRIMRDDDSGTEWCLSGISPKGLQKLDVKPGRVQKVTIPPSITFGARGTAGNGFMIQVPIQGAHHAGVTIYKAGKRIAMSYAITGADGKELESGTMTYG